MRTLEGKVAWITGGATGIGLAAAQALAVAGATVVLSGRRKDALESATAALTETGALCEIEPLDVTDPAAVAAVAQAVTARHGAVDILVNSAGMNIPRRYLPELEIKDWQAMFDVNLNAILYCVKAVLPAMRAQRDGLIINISSWGGKYVVRHGGAAYTAAKHAVVTLNESINIEECINGVRSCVICPAEVSTPFLDTRPTPPTAAQRQTFLQPEDLGRIIRLVAELPPRACVNEIVVSPTHNPWYVSQHPGQPAPSAIGLAAA